MIIFIYLVLIIAMTLILIGVFGSPKLDRRRMQLPKEDQEKITQKRSYLDFILPFSQNLLKVLKLDVKIKNKLDTGHINLTPQEFFSIKLGFMIVSGIGSFFIFGKLEPVVLLVAVSLGYILPDLWLRQKIAQRKFAIARVLPETVDLIGLCVEAGLDFTIAVKWLIEKKVYYNPMIEELTLVLEEIKWGKSRTQALKDMAHRLNIPEVSSFVQALAQAERMGTPVSETFAIISEDTRLQRFRRGERYALQAPIKILIPLIFCILPVIGIVIGGPIFLQFIQGGLFTGFGK